MATNEHDRESSLMAISPIDGRYRSRVRALEAYFSEFALIQYRVRIEVEWYLALAAHPKIDAIKPIAPAIARKLRAIYSSFTVRDAMRIKEIEAETNHDVKAVEYFLKERLPSIDESLPLEMMHFACTSEDINNTSYALILKEFAEGELIPKVTGVMRAIAELARRFKDVPMLSRTHGQEASPTTVGKEMAIFASRVERQIKLLRAQEYLGKFNGAVGNFNAHRSRIPRSTGSSCRRASSKALAWCGIRSQLKSRVTISSPRCSRRFRASTPSCSASAATCGVTFRSATSASAASRARPAPR